MDRKTLSVFALLGAAYLTSCRSLPPAESPAAAASEALPSEPRVVAATGQVQGSREADVGARIPGRVLRFEYEEGEMVEAGAPVVRLEDQDLRARLKEAKATAWDACSNFERLGILAGKGVVAASELEHAQADCARRQAEAEQAAVVLDHATIKAPFAGTLIRKFKEVGEAVSGDTVSDPVFRLADLSSFKVTAEVPEADIARVRSGQPARVKADAYIGPSFPATVSRVALAAGKKRLRSDDPRERLDEKVVEVELQLAPNDLLRSGMTVDVTIETGDQKPWGEAAPSQHS